MDPKKIACPKCGFEQIESKECVRCGVIFARIKETPSSAAGESAFAPPRFEARGNSFRGKAIVLFVLLFILGVVLFREWKSRELRYPPGILIGSAPQQLIIKNPVPWKKNGRAVFPLARFSLKARVLSKETYSGDPGADLSPVDFALGWGPMSDQKIIDELEIGQGNRRFAIAPLNGRLTLPISVLLANSSNMHILPASEEIKKRTDSVRPGDLVAMSGYLVGIQENGQWTWVSSLRRDDTGDGACEIFWVERLEFLTPGN